MTIRDITGNDIDFTFNWDTTLGKRSWISCVHIPTKKIKTEVFDSNEEEYYTVAKKLFNELKKEVEDEK